MNVNEIETSKIEVPQRFITAKITGVLRGGKEIKQELPLKVPAGLKEMDEPAAYVWKIIHSVGGMSENPTPGEYVFYPIEAFESFKVEFSIIQGATICP